MINDIACICDYNQHFVAMINIINKARLTPPVNGHKHHIIPRCWFNMNNLPVDNSDNNLHGDSYKEHYNIEEISKSYYEYKLTTKFPISWNCYQSFYNRGEI